MTTTALQSLQLAKVPPEVQQNTVPGTPSGLVPTTEDSLKDTQISDPLSEQTSNTEYQPTGTRANCINMHYLLFICRLIEKNCNCN